MKAPQVKGIILLVIAATFFAIMLYSLIFEAGDLKVFFSVVIVLVCTGLGIMYLKGEEEKRQKGQRKKNKKK
ncbi:MAG TPA: hypothetical protein PLX02_11960 [Syntrophorhabdaceae bacterium]|nr:hypothetical protein [Syntrophorhabdaceae bacterium]HQM82327.1 hypothetical protein [Syntrophorhabdaceae bacterium]